MEEHQSTQDVDALVAEFNSEIQDVLDKSDRAAIVAELDTNIWKRRNSKLKSSSRGISGNSGRPAKAPRTFSSSMCRRITKHWASDDDSSSDDDSIIELAVSMVLNFDGETYSFTQPMDDPPSYLRPGINKLLDRVIGEDHPYQINNPRDNSFNHLDSRNAGYLELCNQTECIHVEICCIVVKRNIENGCLHIQGVDYRSTFSDGSTKLSSIDCVRSMSNIHSYII